MIKREPVASGRNSSDPVDWEKYLQAYYEKPRSSKTWSGYSVKEIYTPEDMIGKDYDRNIGDAGTYPFTRGIHANMFRGRYWTMREVIGMGSPAQTHTSGSNT